jgi:hypothetical protein
MEIKKGWRIYDRDEAVWYRVKKIKANHLFGKAYHVVNEKTHQIRLFTPERVLREMNYGSFIVLPKQFVCPLD